MIEDGGGKSDGGGGCIRRWNNWCVWGCVMLKRMEKGADDGEEVGGKGDRWW